MNLFYLIFFYFFEDKDQKELKNRLEVLLKKIENRNCADCGQPCPLWANTNLGVFFCIDCSSVHRNLGKKKTEKCQNIVKSVHRDVWTVSQVEAMEKQGNKLSNDFYEAISPERVKKPKESDSPSLKANYIKQKYDDKLFTPDTIETLSQSQSLPLLSLKNNSSIDESTTPKLSQDALDLVNSSKTKKEKTDLEILLLEKYNQYEEDIKLQREKLKRERLNRERIEEIKKQTDELYRLNIIRNIIDKKKEKEHELNEKLVEERNKLLQERRDKLERRKERLAESEKRRWEAVRRAAEREREKQRQLGRSVSVNPYTTTTSQTDDDDNPFGY